MPTIFLIIERGKRGQLWLRAGRTADASEIGPIRLQLGKKTIEQVLAKKDRIAQFIPRWTRLDSLVKEAGEPLFRALIASEEIRVLFDSMISESWRLAEQNGFPVCLDVCLGLLDRGLHTLPWEFMFDPGRRSFLSPMSGFSVSRAMSVRGSPGIRAWRPPVRILVVLATPSVGSMPDLISKQWIKQELEMFDTLTVAESLRKLQGTCSASLDVFRYELLAGLDANRERLQQELTRDHDLLYFVGHSYQDGNDSFMLLEDGRPERRAVVLDSADLAEWLRPSRVRGVIISSCESLAAAETLSTCGKLDFVIANHMLIPDASATVFDEALLRALASWEPVERAVLSARHQVLNRTGRQIASGRTLLRNTDRPDWAIPVLIRSQRSPRNGFCSVESGSYSLGLDSAQCRELSAQFGFREQLPDSVSRWIRKPEQVELSGFQMSQWPITNHQYRYFLDCNHDLLKKKQLLLPRGFEWHNGSISVIHLCPSAPVVSVSREDAEKYCRWAGGRLPSADEWEATARGPNGRLFPWGNQFQRASCALDPSASNARSVLDRVKGASPFGVEDMCGNVFQWTSSNGIRVFQNEGSKHSSTYAAVVGGSWKTAEVFTMPSLRCPRDPTRRYADVGFRCVLESLL